MANGLVILGCGGHARSVADVAISCGYKKIIFVDENAKSGEFIFGFPVFNEITNDLFFDYDFFPGAGSSEKRIYQISMLKEKKMKVVSIISPLASLGLGAEILDGVFVGHHAHIGPQAKIGTGIIVNTASIIEHESVIDDYSHVSVNSVVAGRSYLGKNSMLGAGATIIDGIRVCDNVIIGAGAVVANDIDISGIYVGMPCRKI